MGSRNVNTTIDSCISQGKLKAESVSRKRKKQHIKDQIILLPLVIIVDKYSSGSGKGTIILDKYSSGSKKGTINNLHRPTQELRGDYKKYVESCLKNKDLEVVGWMKDIDQ